MYELKIINRIEENGMFGFDLLGWIIAGTSLGFIPILTAHFLGIAEEWMFMYIPVCIGLSLALYNVRLEKIKVRI